MAAALPHFTRSCLALAALAQESARTPATTPAATPAPIEWGEPELIADEVATDSMVVPLCAAVSASGALVVGWSAGKRDDFGVWVAEKVDGRWMKKLVGRAATTNPPQPQAALDAAGNVVVAWEAPWDHVGAPCFAIRSKESGEWSEPRPIHENCSGEIDLDAGDSSGVRIAYVRGVDKFSGRKLFGNFVHDPPIQPYDKVALGVLVDQAWREQAVIESHDLVAAENPRLIGDHLLYFRDGSLGNVSPDLDLTYVDLRMPDRLETVATYPDLLGGGERDAALAVDQHHPIVAFTGIADRGKKHAFTYFPAVWIGERVDGKWGKPLQLIRHAERPSLVAANGVVHLTAATSGWDSNEILHAARVGGTWSLPQRLCRGDNAELVIWNGRPAVLAAGGMPDRGPRGAVGGKPIDYPRRILLVRPR